MSTNFSSDQATIFDKQYSYAWEHFKFHAEQRTKMFHFFLVMSAFLISAFSIAVEDKTGNYKDLAFIILAAGGVFSTFFISLDVRNSQLLKHSEIILGKIEDEALFPGLNQDNGIKIGILSRERLLKSDTSYSKKGWIKKNFIKHKTSIRGMQLLLMMIFWASSIYASPEDDFILSVSDSFCITIYHIILSIMFLGCILWAGFALSYNQWEEKDERIALINAYNGNIELLNEAVSSISKFNRDVTSKTE